MNELQYVPGVYRLSPKLGSVRYENLRYENNRRCILVIVAYTLVKAYNQNRDSCEYLRTVTNCTMNIDL